MVKQAARKANRLAEDREYKYTSLAVDLNFQLLAEQTAFQAYCVDLAVINEFPQIFLVDDHVIHNKDSCGVWNNDNGLDYFRPFLDNIPTYKIQNDVQKICHSHDTISMLA